MTVIITDSPNIIAKIVSPVKYIGLSFIAAAMSITSAHIDNTNDIKNDNTFMILSFKVSRPCKGKGEAVHFAAPHGFWHGNSSDLFCGLVPVSVPMVALLLN